jgi:hypothetical protein
MQFFASFNAGLVSQIPLQAGTRAYAFRLDTDLPRQSSNNVRPVLVTYILITRICTCTPAFFSYSAHISLAVVPYRDTVQMALIILRYLFQIDRRLADERALANCGLIF